MAVDPEISKVSSTMIKQLGLIVVICLIIGGILEIFILFLNKKIDGWRDLLRKKSKKKENKKNIK
jgi:hypothetical protein